jgi:hypothetical protein
VENSGFTLTSGSTIAASAVIPVSCESGRATDVGLILQSRYAGFWQAQLPEEDADRADYLIFTRAPT